MFVNIVLAVCMLLGMVVLVPCVVNAVTMRVLLFVWDVIMLKECEGDGNAGLGDGKGVVEVSTGFEYMGSTRGSGIVSHADDGLFWQFSFIFVYMLTLVQ